MPQLRMDGVWAEKPNVEGHAFRLARVKRPEILLQSLIRAARDGPEAVLARVDEVLEPLGFTARRTRQAPHAVLHTRGGGDLLFSGHVDVVPAGDDWQRDPFGGDAEDGAVWGRGACDMLGAVAAFIGAAAREPTRPCAILLTTDEETGMRAAERAVEEGFLRGFRAVVVGEPTSLQVGIAEKGVLWLKVATHGRNAHASMPELGDNAAERLVRLLPHLLAAHPRDESHPLLGTGTVSLGRIHGGEAINQVPASATAELDARFLPGTDALGRFREALARSGEAAELEVLSLHPPFETLPDAPLVTRALAAVRAAGIDARILGLPYGTEACKYAPLGLDVVILGPGDAGLAHTNREHVRLDALEAAVAAYAALLRTSSDASLP